MQCINSKLQLFFLNISTAIEIFSNGWQPKAAGACNISGGSFVYMAFAEAPIVGSNNVPATAS